MATPMELRARGGRIVGGIAWWLAAVLTGLVVAYLTASGAWQVALALLLVVPAFVVLHRYPLIAISIWLFMAPLVAVTDDVGNRQIFWLIHRTLPVVTLVAIAFGSILGTSDRKPARLGWPEVMMGGYLVASVFSILFTSDEALATSYLLYDRIFIPMCLYLIVRLHAPTERDLRLLLPAVAFLLISQAVFGLLLWAAPGLLPPEWLGHVGQRTTGSLRDPNVYAVAVLFGGLFVLHRALAGGHGRWIRLGAVALFVVALCMTFLSFARAAWIAGVLATMIVTFAYPRFARRLLLVAVPTVLVIVVSGALNQPLGFARERLTSEESAYSRLPVLVAAVRMFQEKPVVGWGFENFDRYSRPFQGRVADLASAEKPHASHNLYLTILAEQGAVGFVLLLGPPVIWLVRTVRRWGAIPRSGGVDRQLVVLMWAAIAVFVVVNNFAVVRVTFGPGVYWLTLGLIASIVDRARPAARPVERGALGGAIA